MVSPIRPGRPLPASPSSLPRAKADFDGIRPIRLFAPRLFELSYLSWGSRHYGEQPVIPKQSEGWHYFAVLSGSPTMILNGEKIVTKPGVLSISDPACRIGHVDEPGRACEILTWIWRAPPMYSALIPEKRRTLRVDISPAQLRRLKQLHIQGREALAQASEENMLKLHCSRLLLDLCLVEAAETVCVPDAEIRMDFAVRYLQEHINEPLELASLRDYLKISRASLYRLFQNGKGMGPRAFALDLRMKWAQDMLRTGKRSVKEVGYSLGYRYPADFSRAFKQHFGTTASDENEARAELALQD